MLDVIFNSTVYFNAEEIGVSMSCLWGNRTLLKIYEHDEYAVDTTISIYLIFAWQPWKYPYSPARNISDKVKMIARNQSLVISTLYTL